MIQVITNPNRIFKQGNYLMRKNRNWIAFKGHKYHHKNFTSLKEAVEWLVCPEKDFLKGGENDGMLQGNKFCCSDGVTSITKNRRCIF